VSSTRRLLILVSAIVFVDTVFFAALTPLLPHYADEFGIGKTGWGLLQAAYPAGVFVAAVPSGFVAARLGVKPTVMIGLCCIAGTSTAFGFADSVWQLDLARFAQGLASAFSWTGGFAWLLAAAPPARRGALIGTAFAMAIAGALFGPILGGVASVVGTGAAFTAVAAVALAQGFWAWRTPAASPEEPQPLSMLVAAVRTRRVAVAAWFVMLPALLFGTLGVLASFRLHDLGFGAVAIGATWLTAAAFEGALSPVLGHVSDRIGRIKPIMFGLAASAVVVLLLPWPGERFLLAALVVCAGLAFGSFWAPAMSLLSDAAEAQGLDYGYAFALVSLAWAPGQAGGAWLSGRIAAATADVVPYAALSAISAFTLALLWRAGPHRS
jgi:MFS family permease